MVFQPKMDLSNSMGQKASFSKTSRLTVVHPPPPLAQQGRTGNMEKTQTSVVNITELLGKWVNYPYNGII